MARLRVQKRRLVTHYRTLGVSPGDSLEEIHKVYKQLAMVHHPDRRPADLDKFASITFAFGVLKTNREQYDSQLKVMGVLNCKACGGSGLRVKYVKMKKTRDKCELCDGTGEENGTSR